MHVSCVCTCGAHAAGRWTWALVLRRTWVTAPLRPAAAPLPAAAWAGGPGAAAAAHALWPAAHTWHPEAQSRQGDHQHGCPCDFVRPACRRACPGADGPCAWRRAKARPAPAAACTPPAAPAALTVSVCPSNSGHGTCRRLQGVLACGAGRGGAPLSSAAELLRRTGLRSERVVVCCAVAHSAGCASKRQCPKSTDNRAALLQVCHEGDAGSNRLGRTDHGYRERVGHLQSFAIIITGTERSVRLSWSPMSGLAAGHDALPHRLLGCRGRPLITARPAAPQWAAAGGLTPGTPRCAAARARPLHGVPGAPQRRAWAAAPPPCAAARGWRPRCTVQAPPARRRPCSSRQQRR